MLIEILNESPHQFLAYFELSTKAPSSEYNIIQFKYEVLKTALATEHT